MSNTSPNQQRNLKPTGSNPAAYSASPTQLTLSSDTSSIGGFYNPYAQHYGHAPSPHHTTAFGFPQHPPYPQHIQTQTQPAAQAYPPQAQISPQVSRKRRATDDLGADALSATTNSSASAFPSHSLATGAAPADVDFGAPATSQSQLPSPVAKKGRTNTPWTPAEEQRLKTLREAGSSWSEIAKTFPTRTEGSVKKHWYKDMHYAEFAEDESAALLQAIKDYENNKWKVIGQKVGKPAKACEQFAKEQGWKI